MNIFGALYLRISRDKGENEDTLQNHRELMQEFCSRNGYTYQSYEEIVSGGKNDIELRPQMRKLIDNIQKYQAIFAVSLDRLSRNGLVSQQIRQLCIDYDIKIITPSQEFDLANSDEDRLLYDVSSVFASREYEMIGKRNKLNKMQRARRGEHITGKPAYGYRRNKSTKKLEIYKPEAEVIRYIFKLHSQGLGSHRIVDILNSEGYKPQLSNAFNLPTVKRIISNPVYKGTIVFRNRKRVKEDGKYTYKTIETIVTDCAHPAIIPIEEWEQANRERAERAAKAKAIREKPAKVTGVTMLKDLLFCGICGRKLVVSKESNGTYLIKPCEYFLPNSAEKCPNCGIKLVYLEEEIISTLRNHKEKLKKELQLLELKDVSNLETELKERLAHVETQIYESLRKQDNLIDLAVKGIFSHDELRVKKQELIDEHQALKVTKDKLKEQVENINVISHIEHISYVINLLDSFETLPVESKNHALKQFINKIHYIRNIPEELRKLSTRNRERRQFPFEYTVEYF